jgi:uncharacterized protein (TIGR02117 family)
MRRRRWRLASGALAGLLVVWALSTVRPREPALYPAPPGGPAVVVYLIDNGFHTDLALPRARIAAGDGALARAAQRLPASEWISVGWGDAAFYAGTGASLARALDGLRALFAPNNPAVLHLYGFEGRPDRVYANVTPLRLSQAGFDRMAARIDAAFAPGPRLALPASGHTAFFASAEHFSILKLCNHWTGEVLHAAGLPTIGILHLTPAGLKLDLRLGAGVARAPAPPASTGAAPLPTVRPLDERAGG